MYLLLNIGQMVFFFAPILPSNKYSLSAHHMHVLETHQGTDELQSLPPGSSCSSGEGGIANEGLKVK